MIEKELHVAIVDDDHFLLDLMSASLRDYGIAEVTTASNGAAVLAMLDQGKRFDIVLTDLNMPEMDGIELMRHLAERNYQGGIILLTGEHPKVLQTAHDLAEAHDLHLLGVLQKPITRRALKDLMGVHGEKVPAAVVSHTQPEVTVEELADAIRSGHIIPHYQPRVSVAGRQVIGVETLARWQHPQKGMIMPGVFIPLAENNGLISELTKAVLIAAVRQTAVWQDNGLNLKIAVNVSAEDLIDVKLPDRLATWAAAEGVHLSSLILELTESQLMEKLTLTLDTLIRLHLKGVSLAVDDFGTGYSNLGQIKRAPFGELKIDRSFVQEGTKDEEGRAILEASILMGKKLGMTVVAEGVEQVAEWEALLQMGADEMQGYLISRPLPAEEIPAWVAGWQTASEQTAS